MTAHSERARQWVHIGSGAFATLLRFLTWPEAAIAAIAALAFNALLLPRLGGRRLYRDVDRHRGFPVGILLYPASVLLLILVFRSRLDMVAAAWGILAFGDGFATLVGGGAPLPWNRQKSVRGTVAFVVFGAAAGIALAWWTRSAVDPAPPMVFTIAAPLAAAVAAAFVESLPVGLDDNISVPCAAGAMLWLASVMSADALRASADTIVARLPWAVGVNVVVAALGYRARTVSISGTIVGALIGIAIWIGGGGAAWALLFASFFVATAASRVGLDQKADLGIEEERGGRRGAGNAIANCAVAVGAAIAAVTTPYLGASLFALTAALTAGGSDTVASEIGKAWGRSTFLVTTLRRVPAGTPGAMSLEGTAAGIVAAAALAAVAAMLQLVPPNAIPLIVVGATAGALVESVLGATLEGPGILNNDMLNFINTAVAAAVSLALAA
ncbi:MAG TPA: DUF92 domain-containing protein [Vicinamibacterales bacterium]|nr:DUF92 domain-containing protein [Vicinamibacterales bacterium]